MRFCLSQGRPDELRPVGETESIAAIAARAEAAGMRACAGIVGYCDFRLGDPIDAVLEAHVAGRRRTLQGHSPECRLGCGDHHDHDIAGAAGPAARSRIPSRAGTAGQVRAVVRMFAVPSAAAGTDRPCARVSRSADPGQSLRRPDPHRTVSRAARRGVRCLAARSARTGGMSQCVSEAGRPGDDDPRLDVPRGTAAAVIRRTGRGVAALYGNLHRGVRRRSLHVREQLPGRQGHVQLPCGVERIQAPRRRLLG